jgi:dUTPase
MVNKGDRIAQLVIVPVFRARFQELSELGLT